jgi:hypothetical protein
LLYQSLDEVLLQSGFDTANSQSGKDIVSLLSAEIIDAARGRGNSIRKREEVQRIAEANKAFARYRFLNVSVILSTSKI